MDPVLVTGGSGQIGSALRRLAPAGLPIVAPGRQELDLREPERIIDYVASRPWSAIINSGAYTAVDRAESDVTEAWRVNALAPAALAAAASAAAIPMLHLSTDYVFDGTKATAYVEDDPTAPISVYGASKQGGEQAVRTALPDHVILRTGWVFSADGGNFVKTMFQLSGRDAPLRVVADQRGCPTSAQDIAKVILIILERLLADTSNAWGTYHFVSSGDVSWYELACAVMKRGAFHGRPESEVVPITTAEYPTPARRPVNSRLGTGRIEAAFGIAPPYWRDAVDTVVDQLVVGEACR